LISVDEADTYKGKLILIQLIIFTLEEIAEEEEKINPQQ